MGKFIDMTGQRFGSLIVLNRDSDHIQPNGVKTVMWRCKCDCGKETIVAGIRLRKGKTQSCGCYHNRCIANQGLKNKKYNQYDLTKSYGVGFTLKGEAFFFDLEDYDKIKNYCWFLNSDGYVMSNKSASEGYGHIFLHRLIVPIKKGERIDHKNGNPLDNQKSNLRIVNASQNAMNYKIPSNNTSGVRGVIFDKACNKWRAEIKINGKSIYLGRYIQLEAAIAARKEAEEKYFGEYSYDNSRGDI